MAAWRINNAFNPLNEQLEKKFPNIVIYSIGDTAHQAEPSDHNPNKYGRVNAEDFMLRNGFDHADAVWLCSWLIQDSRTKYVIFNRRIWESDTRKWTTYTGSNPHTDHVHLSINDSADWNVHAWKLESSELPTVDEVWNEDVNNSGNGGPYSARGALYTAQLRTGKIANDLLPELLSAVKALDAKVTALDAKVSKLA